MNMYLITKYKIRKFRGIEKKILMSLFSYKSKIQFNKSAIEQNNHEVMYTEKIKLYF